MLKKSLQLFVFGMFVSTISMTSFAQQGQVYRRTVGQQGFGQQAEASRLSSEKSSINAEARAIASISGSLDRERAGIQAEWNQVNMEQTAIQRDSQRIQTSRNPAARSQLAENSQKLESRRRALRVKEGYLQDKYSSLERRRGNLNARQARWTADTNDFNRRYGGHASTSSSTPSSSRLTFDEMAKPKKSSQ